MRARVLVHQPSEAEETSSSRHSSVKINYPAQPHDAPVHHHHQSTDCTVHQVLSPCTWSGFYGPTTYPVINLAKNNSAQCARAVGGGGGHCRCSVEDVHWYKLTLCDKVPFPGPSSVSILKKKGQAQNSSRLQTAAPSLIAEHNLDDLTICSAITQRKKIIIKRGPSVIGRAEGKNIVLFFFCFNLKNLFKWQIIYMYIVNVHLFIQQMLLLWQEVTFVVVVVLGFLFKSISYSHLRHFALASATITICAS